MSIFRTHCTLACVSCILITSICLSAAMYLARACPDPESYWLLARPALGIIASVSFTATFAASQAVAIIASAADPFPADRPARKAPRVSLQQRQLG